MAPVVAHELAGLVKRAYCDYGWIDSSGRCHRSSWGWWGRWVLAGAIVLIFILVLLMLSRRNARARRARGQRPLYGTGFLAGPAPPYTPYPQNGSTNVQGGPPPPQYVYPDNTGNKFNANDGYYGPPQGDSSNPYNNNNNNYNSSPYGGQQSGIELQQPPQTYQRGTGDDYAPPEGPPPSKRT
ncbi:Chitin synthesis regulation, resistance to Congo red domain containing protein [Rhypophila sp. PSN 637]